MKRLFFIFILSCATFLHAGIDERKSDVYFVNGIDISEREAERSKDKLLREIQKSSPESFKQVSEWKTNYNHTRGFKADVYEMAIQKIYKKLNEDKKWEYGAATIWIIDETLGKIPGAKDVVKGVIQYAGKKVGKGVLKDMVLEEVKSALWKKGFELSKEDIAFLSEEVFDGVIDDLLDGLKEETVDDIDKDVDTHYNAYNNSIKDGHGVIIVSHGQGNFFTNFIIEGYQNAGHPLIADWQKKYIHAFGVAPSTSSIANGGGYVTFDNDIIQAVPGHLGWNVKNPKRYYYKNANTIETTFSIKAHSFLSSYMATPVTKNKILNFISSAIENHKNAPSQWVYFSKKEEDICKVREFATCDGKLRDVHHISNLPEMNALMEQTKVVPFDERGKLYMVNNISDILISNNNNIKQYKSISFI